MERSVMLEKIKTIKNESFEYDQIYGKINLLNALKELREAEKKKIKEYELFEKMHSCDGTFTKSNRISL